MENNKVRDFLGWLVRLVRDGLAWEALRFVVVAIFGALATILDPAGLVARMNNFVAFIIYLFLGLIIMLGLRAAWALRDTAMKRIRFLTGKWKLVPRDFGLDSLGSRRVGFAIEESRGVFEATLEMFWFSGHEKPDEMQFRYALNLTSHRLRKTADGQFMLAIASPLEPFGFHLILEDGYYGEFLLAVYYKARISVSDNSKGGKTCFDVLIRYEGRDAIEVVELNKIDCDDPLIHIPPEEKVDDDSSKNWSTLKGFQPNQMYRKQ